MTDEQQILNWKADKLEGLIYCCNENCEHINEKQLNEFYNNENENFPCKCEDCKYKNEYNEIVKNIKNRTTCI